MRTILLSAVAFVALTATGFAQDKNDDPPKATKKEISEAAKIVEATSKDEAKVKLYCEMLALDQQAGEAIDKKNDKEVEEIGKKLEEKEKAIGEDFTKAMSVLARVDPDSDDGQELEKALEGLDSACGEGEKK